MFGTKTITSGVYGNILELSACDSSLNIECQRLADGAGLFRSVKNGDLLDSLRDSCQESFCAERSVQTNLYDTNLLAGCVEVINSLFNGLVDGAHSDDDLLSVFCAIVVEQLVICAELSIDLVHVFLNYCGHSEISGVACLTGLEEQVRVLSTAHLTRMRRVQAVSAELCDRIVVDQVIEIVIVPDLDLLDLVGCAETIEEVDERQFALYCCAVSDGSQIHDFLYAGLTEHSAAGLSCPVCLAAYTSE